MQSMSKKAHNRKLQPRIWEPTYLLNRTLGSDLQKLVEKYFPTGTDWNVLDIGCGTMPYRGLFEGRCGTYLGCDLYSKDEDVVKCPADNLSFADASFDATVCFQVLEHVPEPWRVMEETARVLKPGGIAIVTIPFLFPYHGSPKDYYRYTHEGIAFLGKRVGLYTIETVPQVDVITTMLMILNIKVVELLGPFKKLPVLRTLTQFFEQAIFVVINLAGLFTSLFDRRQYERGFPGYANYSVVLRRRTAA